MPTIKYSPPENWIYYKHDSIYNELMNAKASVLALQAIPFQRRWIQEIERIQLKMEVAGTSRIEGADFAGNELDMAMKASTPQELITRSQKQAASAVGAYKWISDVPEDRPIDEELILHIHRLMVTGCDDDHCVAGEIRRCDQNVTFGVPKHRGAAGGEECKRAFERLVRESRTTYKTHDAFVQAIALHYHLAAMHPFLDGNGRVARALEALMLQRAGLRKCLFIALSNFYYEEKPTYLATLAAVRSGNHDLTPFLKFGLSGIALQASRLTRLIKHQVSKEIFRNLMNDLFVRLESTRKRVIVKRQLTLLQKLLNIDGEIEFFDLADAVRAEYSTRKNPTHAVIRDFGRLLDLGAVTFRTDQSDPKSSKLMVSVNLDWPATITETEFFTKLQKLPKSKTYGFLSSR